MTSTFNSKNTHMLWLLFLALLTFFMLWDMGVVQATIATTPTVGFAEVARRVHVELDGNLGTVIGLVGGGLATVGLIRGFNGAVVGGGLGVAMASAVGPDLVVALNGGFLLR